MPLYVVLLGAAVLIIAVLYRKLRSKRREKRHIYSTNAETSPDVYNEIKEQKLEPKKIRVDHSNISATFSNDI